jgi:hypothetical protein
VPTHAKHACSCDVVHLGPHVLPWHLFWTHLASLSSVGACSPSTLSICRAFVVLKEVGSLHRGLEKALDQIEAERTAKASLEAAAIARAAGQEVIHEMPLPVLRYSC